jgi:amino acid adenylation domain-containing protein
MVESGPSALVGMLAILSSGRPFVPLDPINPEERLRRIAEECEVEVVVTERSLEGKARGLGAGRLIFRDEPEPGGEGAELPAEIPLEQAAYVLYTSGSTGTPKGVVVRHGDLATILLSAHHRFGYGDDNRVFQTLSYAFDFGVFEQLTTVLFGGTLYFMPRGRLGDGPATAEFLERFAAGGEAPRTIHATPSFLRALLAGGVDLRGFDMMDLGGEALGWDEVEALHAEVGAATRIVNGYGPTEATINSSFFEVGRGRRWPGRPGVPIGRASGNHRLYVLDARGRPVAVGVPGELHVGGHLARGYHRRAALTAEKLVPDAWSGLAGERLYRSGDRVCWLPDGELEFLGRIDDQVKLRGFRVELGEIEAVLHRHPSVKQAHVRVREDRRGIPRLVAWLLVRSPIPVDELRQLARRTLPEIMVPQVFVELDSLPRTASGKVDPRALPDPEWDAAPETEHVAPRSSLEELLAEIWGELLGIEDVGVHDDFFALGGHSLLMTRMISRIRDELDVELTPRAIFEAPTVAGLAVALAEALLAEAGDELADEVLAGTAEEGVR